MSRMKSLLLTFDAFGTLFTPRRSIAKQYVEMGSKYGIDVSEDDLQQSFRLGQPHSFVSSVLANLK